METHRFFWVEGGSHLNEMIEKELIPEVPIMAIKANMAKTDIEERFKYMQYYLEKPFSFMKLAK